MADRSGDALIPAPEITDAPDEVIQVPVDDDEDEGEAEAGPSPPPSSDRPSRAQRRRERGQSLVAQTRQELEAARAEIAAEREKTAALERRVAEQETRGRQVVEHLSRTQGDPLEAAKLPLLQRKQALANEWANLPDDRKLDPNVQLDFHRRAEAVDQELTTLRVRATQPSEEQQQQVIQARVAEARVRELHSRYPEVVNNPRGWDKVQELYHAAKAEGRPVTADLAEECFKKARDWLTGGRPDLPHERVRTGGISGARGAPPPDAPRTVAMTRSMRYIAELQYPDLPPAEAHKKWAKHDSGAYTENLRENQAVLARREKA